MNLGEELRATWLLNGKEIIEIKISKMYLKWNKTKWLTESCEYNKVIIEAEFRVFILWHSIDSSDIK